MKLLENILILFLLILFVGAAYSFGTYEDKNSKIIQIDCFDKFNNKINEVSCEEIVYECNWVQDLYLIPCYKKDAFQNNGVKEK